MTFPTLNIPLDDLAGTAINFAMMMMPLLAIAGGMWIGYGIIKSAANMLTSLGGTAGWQRPGGAFDTAQQGTLDSIVSRDGDRVMARNVSRSTSGAGIYYDVARGNYIVAAGGSEIARAGTMEQAEDQLTMYEWNAERRKR